MRASFQKMVDGLRRIASNAASRLFASAAWPRNENAIFNEAVNNLPQGIVVFDKDRRVVFCNARYRDIYHLPPDRAKAGTPVSDLIRHRVSLGHGDRWEVGRRPDPGCRDSFRRRPRGCGRQNPAAFSWQTDRT